MEVQLLNTVVHPHHVILQFKFAAFSLHIKFDFSIFHMRINITDHCSLCSELKACSSNDNAFQIPQISNFF